MQEEFPASNASTFKYSAFTEIKDIVKYFIQNWMWFLIAIIITCFTVFLYLRYKVPQYNASIRVLIKDEDRSGGNFDPTAAVFSDLGTLSNFNTNLENEIEMIGSRAIVRNAIKALNLNTIYTLEGNLKNQEIYENKPIDLLIKSFNVDFNDNAFRYKIRGVNDSSFDLYSNNGDKIGTFTYGETIKVDQGDIVFIKTENYAKYIIQPFEIAIDFYPVDVIVDQYLQKIAISRPNKNTNIIEISIVGPIRKKSEDFLDTLVKEYNKDVVIDKNIVFENTSKFIEDRIEKIAEELDTVEKSTENFKRENHLTNLENEALMFTAGANDFQIKMLEAETQIKVIETMQDYVTNNKDFNVLPENIISLNSPTSGLITNYNQLVLERKRFLQDAGPKHEKVLQIVAKLEELHASILSSLNQLKSNYQLQKQNLQTQNSQYNFKISQVPSLERKTKNLGRQQNIKEQLYLYLLQKREETAISLAVTAPNAKAIDFARASKQSTTPKSSVLYLAAILLGLLLPAGILYLIKISNNKIKNRRELEAILPIPILGEIPKNVSENNLEIVSGSSVIAEAIRIIRSNLNFILPNKVDNVGQVIFVTSTLPKEGKTFISTNIAATLALTGKKIALVGLDIRNPKIHQYIKTQNIGVTNYLRSNETELDYFAHKIDGYENFYVIPSGPIPPNPAELLLSNKTQMLFEKLKSQFDYIIVDNSPMHLVADTQLISGFADAFIYVIRANYLDKDLLHLPYSLYQDKKLKNMSLILNDVNPNDSYYGYSYYTYGYTEDNRTSKKDKLKKIKNKFLKK